METPPPSDVDVRDLVGALQDIDDAAIRFYRLVWTLSDVAALAGLFRRPHTATPWFEQKFASFVELLDAGRPVPYGRI